MATEAPAPPSSTPAVGDRGVTRSSPAETLLALGVYAVLSLVFFGLKVLPHLGRECVCGFGNDPGTYMWYLAWWPHALLHGMNPFLTSAVFAPHHLDIGAVTLIPGPALLLAPVTLLAGPMVSYNVIVLASPILAALFAFLLCRYITRNFAAALVGGYLFGFSSYMLGHMLGHPNLVLTFPIPAGIHLVLRFMDRRITTRRFVGLMALDLAALVSFSTELALTFVLAGALTLGLALLFAPGLRGVLLGTLRALLLAGGIAAIVTSPLIYYAFKGNIAGAFAGAGDTWAGDLLGYVIPTRLTALGGSWFPSVSSRFTVNDIAESGIYVGIPLALMITCYVVPRLQRPLTRVLLCVLAIVSVLVLGSHLYVDAVAGHRRAAAPQAGASGAARHVCVPDRGRDRGAVARLAGGETLGNGEMGTCRGQHCVPVSEHRQRPVAQRAVQPSLLHNHRVPSVHLSRRDRLGSSMAGIQRLRHVVASRDWDVVPACRRISGQASTA
jgi:hypothetical protein